jgi:hypothetical protein
MWTSYMVGMDATSSTSYGKQNLLVDWACAILPESIASHKKAVHIPGGHRVVTTEHVDIRSASIAWKNKGCATWE